MNFFMFSKHGVIKNLDAIAPVPDKTGDATAGGNYSTCTWTTVEATNLTRILDIVQAITEVFVVDLEENLTSK